MSDRIPCEFFLVRYVPDVVREEFVNIGLILRQVRDDGLTTAEDVIVCFTRDWARVRCLDPDADIDLLRGLEHEFSNHLLKDLPSPLAEVDDLNDVLLAGVEGRHLEQYAVSAVLAEFGDTLSNSIQIVGPRVCLAESTAIEVEELMRTYVKSA